MDFCENRKVNVDLFPWDYHMFGSQKKKILSGRRFASDDEDTNAVHTWVRSQQQAFFADEVRRLVSRYKMCVIRKE
jgi:hypothetical protein